MPAIITRPLRDFPEYADILGDILLGYGEIETFVISTTAVAANISADDAIRILYRLKGAQSRLDVADAIMRPFFIKENLDGPYGQWLGAMRRCKAIRNQYAHCAWHVNKGFPWFADMEAAAQSVDGKMTLRFHRLDLDLLKKQRDFFSYAEDVIFYLMKEGRFRKDRRRRHSWLLPKSRAVPKLYSSQN